MWSTDKIFSPNDKPKLLDLKRKYKSKTRHKSFEREELSN